MSRTCTLFTTSSSEEKLVKLIKAEENRAMGSGGYAIEQALERPGGAIDLSFCRLDYDGSPKNHAFIKGGQIWATRMSGWLVNLLKQNEVGFTRKQVSSPAFINSYMAGLIATDERHTLRYG